MLTLCTDQRRIWWERSWEFTLYIHMPNDYESNFKQTRWPSTRSFIQWDRLVWRNCVRKYPPVGRLLLTLHTDQVGRCNIQIISQCNPCSLSNEKLCTHSSGQGSCGNDDHADFWFWVCSAQRWGLWTRSHLWQSASPRPRPRSSSGPRSTLTITRKVWRYFMTRC